MIRRFAVIAALAGACWCGASAQAMRENALHSLFADDKAVRVGDAITILVVESSAASNDAKTSTSRESNLSLSANGHSGTTSPGLDAGFGVGTGNSFKGEGATQTNGSIRAKLSARVDSVLPNGNIAIKGTKTIVINGEEQNINISGLVRTSDIAADNSVYSYNIAEARIEFKGNGIVSAAQGPGWITKLLHWLF